MLRLTPKLQPPKWLRHVQRVCCYPHHLRRHNRRHHLQIRVLDSFPMKLLELLQLGAAVISSIVSMSSIDHLAQFDPVGHAPSRETFTSGVCSGAHHPDPPTAHRP